MLLTIALGVKFRQSGGLAAYARVEENAMLI
jgi:hypothetical protein